MKMQAKSRLLFIAGAAFLALGLGFWAVQSATGLYAEAVQKRAEKAKEKEGDDYLYLEMFGRAFEITRARYVDEPTSKQLVEAAIDGMLSKLDPHSGFLGEDDFREMNETTSGGFGGLGIEVSMDKGVVKVVSPIDDTPAFKAGIEAGDLITHIDGAQVHGLSLQEAIKKMKGRPGTKVVLKIFREGREPFDAKLVRAIIKVDAVKSRQRGNIGVIRLSTFNENTTSELKKAVAELEKKKVAGYVLDLRNNTGGLLDQAVSVADLFLEQGEVVSIMTRSEEGGRVFFATPGDLTEGKPVVALINGGSASAAEIVAGALKDHRRAVVMGTKSYGKGSVQTLVPMGESGTALKITTARYYTPSGKSIQAEGIEPDVVVNRARIEEFKEDRIFAEETLSNALKNDSVSAEIDEAKKDSKKSRAEREDDRDAKDYQLQRAIDMVNGLAAYNAKPAEKTAAQPAKAVKKEPAQK